MTISNTTDTGLLRNFRILEVGPRLASAVTGRMFAELGAEVIKVEPAGGDPARRRGPFSHDRSNEGGGLFVSQNVGKRIVELDLGDGESFESFKNLAREADLIVSSWHPTDSRNYSLDPASLQELNPSAVIVYITPFGLFGPSSEYTGSDLVVFHSSGLAKSLIGPVDAPETTPPVRASGQQAEFISGVSAACSGMLGLFREESSNTGAVIDVSMQESLAFMDVVSLAAKSFGKPGRPRKKEAISGPNLTMLPASDGFIAISPREELQWKNFLKLLGDPDWGDDPRFADRELREKNAEAVIAHLSDWSRTKGKMEMFHFLQENRIPCYPLLNPSDHLDSEQLQARNYFGLVNIGKWKDVKLPGTPYKFSGVPVGSDRKQLTEVDGSEIDWSPRGSGSSGSSGGRPGDSNSEKKLPLAGVRVADLSWVIAGPTCTRYLASMGAEVVKVETSSRPDPGRAGHLHDVLGQGKLGITLNLKSEDGLVAIKKLIAGSDILVENFAPGVMERLGLGWDVLEEINPKLVMISASGTGQIGPTRAYAAYGTLLQVFTGFARHNGYPDQPTSIGMAWADPLCGMLLAFSGVAALRSSRLTGDGQHIDFSMVEAMLSTMPEPLMEYQLTRESREPEGNDDDEFFPHSVYKALGDDSWVAIAVTSDSEWGALADVINSPDNSRSWDVSERRDNVPSINRLIEAWAGRLLPGEAARILQEAGVSASASLSSGELVEDAHLKERGFFKALPDRNGETRMMPTLPWLWHGDHEPNYSRPPALGGDTKFVLKTILGYSDTEIEKMEESGALE
jgi:crotonobetainyl-CoA:carnitine CoA-transferase CaiB-like acyl-CoA transferase